MRSVPRSRARRVLAGLLAVTGSMFVAVPGASAAQATVSTSTPIKHVVVIFDENVSFDHYFGTYPDAADTDGTPFTAAAGTPRPTNLLSADGKLLSTNPNAYQPRRLGPAEALTCDQNHSYAPEQKAYDGGAADKFVQFTSGDVCTGQYGSPGLTMDYYDGNTVTALWNYAQNYAMSDNSFASTYGPSTPGALNLVAGNTHGVTSVDSVTGVRTPTPAGFVRSPDSGGVGTLYGDNDPAFDDCSDNNHSATGALAAMSGRNIGDLLTASNVTWGWFQGGFRPTSAPGAPAVCGTTHANVADESSVDYSPHHEPFQYYRSTANPHHLPPTSTAAIGHTDQANHQYDLTDFDTALAADNLPAVSFLKAGEYQDAHAAYSDPLDEQNFLTGQINRIEKSPDWSSTAIVVAYDDSDGWYDQVAAAVTNGSTDTNTDGNGDTPMCQAGPTALAGQADRCGPGPRLPLLVISPYARRNFVDHTETTQASVLRFVEDNWRVGRLGGGSFDAAAGSLAGMFDFRAPQQRAVLVAPNGSVAATVPVRVAPGGSTLGSAPVTVAGAWPGANSTATSSGATATATATDVHDVAWTGTDYAWLIGVVAIVVGAGGGFWFTRRRRVTG
jgi:phospholipase C